MNASRGSLLSFIWLHKLFTAPVWPIKVYLKFFQIPHQIIHSLVSMKKQFQFQQPKQKTKWNMKKKHVKKECMILNFPKVFFFFCLQRGYLFEQNKKFFLFLLYFIRICFNCLTSSQTFYNFNQRAKNNKSLDLISFFLKTLKVFVSEQILLYILYCFCFQKFSKIIWKKKWKLFQDSTMLFYSYTAEIPKLCAAVSSQVRREA